MNDERERFTFRVPKRLMQAIKEKAEVLGVSVNALILQILWEWAKKEAGKEKFYA